MSRSRSWICLPGRAGSPWRGRFTCSARELDRVSPQLRRRAALELDRRVLTPVLERDDFGWMALNVTRPEQRPNNWTPWIAASVLTTDLLGEPDHDRRARIAHKMLRSLDGFLVFHPADGSCDEGPGYWGQAGGSLFDALEILHSATGGKLDVYGDPLIRKIGQFIVRAHIAGDYFVPVGDCAARFEPERGLVFRYGKRIQDPTCKRWPPPAPRWNPSWQGGSLAASCRRCSRRAKSSPPRRSSAPLLREVWLASDEMQLMAARSRAGSPEGLYVAAWGGHNAQSHNHNDVGNVLVFADGQPVLVDAGAPTYTAQTFSSKRYDHWAFQSAFHNLPTINGVMQGVGRSFAASRVRCRNQRRVRGAADGHRPSLSRGGPGEVVAPHREAQSRPERRDHRSVRVDGGRRRHDAQLPHAAGG